jgi:hypothetical protein
VANPLRSESRRMQSLKSIAGLSINIPVAALSNIMPNTPIQKSPLA